MNGILLVDKPSDWTSFDVAAKLKGVFHTGRIGHAGTLDPMATGLLVMFVGRATRAAEYAEAREKCYLASFRPGTVTDTQDISGHVLSSCPAELREETIRALLPAFTGTIMQVPPMYSAIKVNGQRLYDIARKGGTVERSPRPVTIHELTLLGQEEQGDWRLRVVCSKGTYIRTLCHDMGQALGCGGCMSALRRVSVGSFRIEEAHTLPEILECARRGEAENLLLPVESLFSSYPAFTADEAQEKRIRCGTEFAAALSDGHYRVYGSSGEFLMLGRAEAGRLYTEKNFFEPEVT